MGIRGAIGTRRRRREVAPRRIDRERAALLGSDDGLSARDREILQRVDVHVDPRDTMHAGDTAHYLRVGLSAIRCIEGDGQPPVAPPRRVLDLPCGHGRVLRALAAAYPGAQLTASDIDRDGVDFCARRFGAQPVYSSAAIGSVDLPGEQDLVWCGSLATHLDEAATRALIAKLASTLAPGGRLAVTTHGRSVADRIRCGEADYQLDAPGVERLLAGYDTNGFGYADYAWSPGYGVSLIAPEWMRAAAPRPVVHFDERCWDGHQDVYILA